MQTWVDNGNGLSEPPGANIVTDTGSQPVDLVNASNSTGSVAFNGVVPYSLTTQTRATFNGLASVSLNNQLQITPAPYTPQISLVKLTNGTDNNAAPGPYVQVGSPVTWTYDVTNPGNEPIAGVTVTDDHAGVTPAYQSGDANGNGLLDPGETWVYTASGTAVAGQYTNLGTAAGTPVTQSGGAIPGATPVSATNPDNYFGVQPGIKVVKTTNGTDNDTGTGPLVPVGS